MASFTFIWFSCLCSQHRWQCGHLGCSSGYRKMNMLIANDMAAIWILLQPCELLVVWFLIWKDLFTSKLAISYVKSLLFIVMNFSISSLWQIPDWYRVMWHWRICCRWFLWTSVFCWESNSEVVCLHCLLWTCYFEWDV